MPTTKTPAEAIDGVLLTIIEEPPYAPTGKVMMTPEDWPPIKEALAAAGWKVVPA